MPAHRASTVLALVLATGCVQSKAPASPADANHNESGKASAHGLVTQATSCWMGGLWSDALGESGTDRYAGVERRCNALLRDIDITARERARALADKVPPPQPEEGYYPLRAVEPRIVDAVAQEVRARAESDPAEGPHARELESLLHAVAAATRETIEARRAADKVKDDVLGQPSMISREADKIDAATFIRAGDALHALIHADAGVYTDEAHAIGVLSALDRMEIARGLPKHLKALAVATAYSDVFGVARPPDVPEDASAHMKGGTWLAYLTDVATAAGHPVPSDAHDPQNREPLAWAGVLEGFADKLRADAARFAPGTPIADVERRVVTRLDQEFGSEREIYAAHAPADR